MKKLFYALAFLFCGVASAGAQDLAVGNVYSEELDQVFQEGENSIHYTFQYSITYLESKQLQIEASMIWGDKVPAGAIDTMYMFLVREYGSTRLNCNITTDKEGGFELGEELNISFYVPAASGARVQTDINYIVGSKNEASANTLGLTASVDKITQTSAEIAYEVSLPDGYEGADITVNYSVDGESKEATSSPISLTDLTPGTNYEYTLVATATLSGKETLTSKEVKVSFTTERDLSKEYHNYQFANGFLTNVYLPGEDPNTDRRSLPISAIGDFCYNPDKTVTVNFRLTGEGTKAVGFVCEINIDDYSKALPLIDGVYSYTTSKKYEVGDRILPFMYPAYDGGVDRIEFPWITIGETNEPVAYGEPKEIKILANKTILEAGERVSFYPYMVDENGNYLLENKPVAKFDENNNEAEGTVNGDFVTFKNKGFSTLTVTYGTLSNSIEFLIAKNISSGMIPSVCEESHVTTNLEFATDGNEGSELIFDCNETDEHWMTFDFGQEYNIELIKLVWEGASASEYTIELAREDKSISQTFVIKKEIGGNGTDPRRQIEGGNSVARYLTLKTFKATNSGWGIKLKEIEVYGNEETYAHVGAFEPQAWHPNFVVLEDFVELPEGFTYEDVTAEVSAVDSGNWATKDFLKNTPWLEKMYDEIMATGTVNANDGISDPIEKKCDGFYDGNATVEVVRGSEDNYATLKLAVDCSGVYKITISSEKDIVFNIDGEGTNGSTVSHDIQIYPTFDHKYSYYHEYTDGEGTAVSNLIENDVFNINDYPYKNPVDGLLYQSSTEAIEALKEAVITIPGVFGADVYYWIDATKAAPGEDKNVTTPPSEKEFAKRRAASLPAGYENYQPIGTYSTDLSDLAKGGTLHLVMAKNGAVTPLETGSNSASQINVTLDGNVETGVEGIATEDNALVDIYTLQGVCVAKAVNFEAVKTSLTPGIYIVGNKKVAVR